jgi:hypothetical protein
MSSVNLAVRIEIGSHETDFHENLYLSIFQKRVEKNKFSLKSDKNIGHFT